MAADGRGCWLKPRDGEFRPGGAGNGLHIEGNIDQAAAVFPVQPRGGTVDRVHPDRLACRSAGGPERPVMEIAEYVAAIAAERRQHSAR